MASVANTVEIINLQHYRNSIYMMTTLEVSLYTWVSRKAMHKYLQGRGINVNMAVLVEKLKYISSGPP